MKGNQKYLRKAIDKAVEWKNAVILIGDQSNREFSDKWFDVNSLDLSKYNEFTKIYQYMSKNPTGLNCCILRDLRAPGLCGKNQLRDFIMYDSDLMIYGDLHKYYYGKCIKAFSFCKNQANYRWEALHHCTYWTKSVLDILLNSCLKCIRIGLTNRKENGNTIPLKIWEYLRHDIATFMLARAF